jgi:long-chain acyl-CoA synthetase
MTDTFFHDRYTVNDIRTMNLPACPDASTSLAPAAAALLAPGGAYELTTANIRGVTLPVFRHAPPDLGALYRDALAHADATFYVYEGERYSFADAWARATRVMAGLRELGVRPGDRVGIALRNYPEWVFAFMGITAMGGVAVAMNAWWSGAELLYGVEDSGLRVLFADAERLERLLPLLDEAPQCAGIALVAVRAPGVQHQRVRHWDAFIAGATGHTAAPAAIHPDDHATLLYTSGSTSRPKGVVSSHRAVIHSLLGWEAAAALARAAAGRPTPARLPTHKDAASGACQPAIILTVPLFHVTGLTGQLLPSLRNGRKVVGMHKWDAERALAIIERERVTHFSGVPSMAYELVNSPNYSKHDLSSLRSIGGGGAAMTPKHSRAIAERSGSHGRTRTSAAYAMTETNGLAASNAGADLQARPTSCGRALAPLVEIRIIGADGEALAAGETGEICIRGAMNFSGYWNRPADTAHTLVDGWVHTGDLGHMDAEGFVFITDRAKEMIIRGGENIGCQEVESALYEHPEVAECAVFGLPDERLGECVAAVVRVHPGARLTPEALLAHATARLARFKVPTQVWLRSTELPRTASGKIFRRGIRDEVIASTAASVTAAATAGRVAEPA